MVDTPQTIRYNTGGGRSTGMRSERFPVHYVGGAEATMRVALHRELDVIWVPDAGCGDVQLAVREAWRIEADTDTSKSLTLRLVDGHRKGEAHRELHTQRCMRQCKSGNDQVFDSVWAVWCERVPVCDATQTANSLAQHIDGCAE